MILVIALALSAAVFVYELHKVAPLIWHADEQQVVLNVGAGR
jgi:hypothetical protein